MNTSDQEKIKELQTEVKRIKELQAEIKRLKEFEAEIKRLKERKPKKVRKVCSIEGCEKHTYKDKCRQHSVKTCLKPGCDRGAWNDYCSKHSEHTAQVKRECAAKRRQREREDKFANKLLAKQQVSM